MKALVQKYQSFAGVKFRHQFQVPIRKQRIGFLQKSQVTQCASGIDCPPIMVNSCAGKMGHAAAEAVVRAGLELVPVTFTAETIGVAVENIGVNGVPVAVYGLERQQEVMDEIKSKYPDVIIVDFTLPLCVNENAQFYIQNRLPFVMGTTGGDRERLISESESAGIYAVIAPQMGKQVVAFQAMMETMGDNFPGAFSGYKLDVVESHQTTKADTSGTAKAVVQSFQKMGVDFEMNQIRKIRESQKSIEEMGVPENALMGHAFHTYRLTSPDGSVSFEFQHNVCGRQIYAEGTVDACLFLAKQIKDGSDKKVFNMIDVLKAGAMR
eukprot:TRINITY_DN12447_c0_g3_i1.p1 TRINITY_DN12447_c0_g3~~TRINITY_DN12447_c0_g3_i1.p1  ORF type:complete len:324 (-),score=38.12 TRINITY_DN12447_c0_g3_i1:324-1295(-)